MSVGTFWVPWYCRSKDLAWSDDFTTSPLGIVERARCGCWAEFIILWRSRTERTIESRPHYDSECSDKHIIGEVLGMTKGPVMTTARRGSEKNIRYQDRMRGLKT